MQMHRNAASEAGYDWDELDNPRKAIFPGAAYPKQQLDRFGGDERRATMAYNGGARTVDESPALVGGEQLELIHSWLPLRQETVSFRTASAASRPLPRRDPPALIAV
jgi:hypothetical protein